MNDIERAKAMLAGSSMKVPRHDNPDDVREYAPMAKEDIDRLVVGSTFVYVYQNKAYHMTVVKTPTLDTPGPLHCEFGSYKTKGFFRMHLSWAERVMVPL